MTAMTTTALSKLTWGTDANFRNDGLIINGFLAGTGSLTQTTDTGQINWSTVTHATVANTAAGYEIWKFNDSLAATAPIYFKLEYGTGSTAPTTGSFWITIGTGSDGAGTITGIFQARTQVSSGNTALGTNAGQERGWANGGDSACVMALAVPSGAGFNSGAYLFSIERTRDWDGTATADGVMYLFAPVSSSSTFPTTVGGTQRFYSTSVGTLNNTTTNFFGVAQPGLSTVTLASGADVYFFPIAHANTGFKVHGPSKYWVGCAFGDVGAGNTVALTVYGTSYNYLSLTNAVRNNTNQSLCIRTN